MWKTTAYNELAFITILERVFSVRCLKRALSVLLAIALGLGIVVPAFAAGAEPEEPDEGEETNPYAQALWWLVLLTFPLGILATLFSLWIVPFVPVLRLVFLMMPFLPLLPAIYSLIWPVMFIG